MTKDEAREILQKLSNGVLTFMEAEAIDCAIQALGDRWVSLLDRIPTDQDGDENGKVLIYRKMNDSQMPLEKSVHDWYLVKNCDPTETFWQPLPPKPKQP